MSSPLKLKIPASAKAAGQPPVKRDSGILQPSPATLPVTLKERAAEAVGRTQRHYLSTQHRDGYWWYELESNVTITAEYLMLLNLLDIRDARRDWKLANHILKHQRKDGSWALYKGGRGDISITVEAYFALKLAGHDAQSGPLKLARAFILENGGVEAARVFTKIYLALFGQYDWRAVPSVPVEINLLPDWFPFNIYSFSSWARSTLVPLSIVLDRKQVKAVPEALGVRELFKAPGALPPITNEKLPPLSWKKIFIALDRALKTVERAGIRPLRDRAVKKTEEWILDHQEWSGDWGGIQPAMVNSVLALFTLGYSVDSAPVAKGLQALKAFTIERENEILLQSCISPVWDTALTSLALLHSGMGKGHPSLLKACKWLSSKQISARGDWCVKRPGLEPGGWAFEFENSWYPDVDDSAVVLMFLGRYAGGPFRDGDFKRGMDWVLGMQGRDGGWGAFDADNNMRILNQLPFGDLEAMIDPSTPDLAGRVLELMGMQGFGIAHPAVRRALDFIKRNQEEDGSWWGRWGVNHIYGTNAVLNGLSSIGEDMRAPYVRKAVEWLRSARNPDGGWGESCASYDREPLPANAASTPSQTAWAVLALIAAGEGASAEVENGVRFLIERQNDDGTWDEEEFTGTGFPRHFFIRYHNYRNCFPLMALGRFLSIGVN